MGKLRHLALAGSALAGLGLGSAAYAETTVITFGQVGSSKTVKAIGVAGSGTTIDISNAVAQVTQYLIAGAPFSAYVDLAATSSDAAIKLGSNVFQDYNGNFCVSSAKNCGGIDYLSGIFTDAVFGTGSQLSVTVGAPPDTLILSSSLIPGDELVDPAGLGFTFTDLSPAPASITGTGSKATIASFTATFAGNASASTVPEPSTWAMMGIGFVGLGFAAFRRSRRTAISIA